MTKSLPKMPKMPKITQQVRCACGCTGLTGSRFVPGHDSKLKGMRIRVERGLWTRTPEGEDINPIDQLDALAEYFTDGHAEATAIEMGIEWTPKAERKEEVA